MNQFASRATVVLALVLFLLVISSAFATGQVAPRLDVFGGYSYMRFDAPSIGVADYANLNGWNIDVGANLTRRFGVAVDASGHYGSQLTVYNYMIGPQYTWRREKSKFFAHAFIGKAQNSVNVVQPSLAGFKSVGRMFAAGGGFDYDWRPRWSIRVFQADYVNSSTFAATQNDVRVSTGVVFHFGHIGHAPRL